MAAISTITSPPPGSIVVLEGRGAISRVIQGWTCSNKSHVTAVCDIDQHHLRPPRVRQVRRWEERPGLVDGWRAGRYVAESTSISDRPCAIQGRTFCGVQVHRYEDYVRGYRGRVYVMRPVTPLDPDESQRLTEICLDWVGVPYDTPGAIISGLRLLKRWVLFSRAADHKTAFCSEVLKIWLAYTYQGRIFPDIDAGQLNPAEIVDLMQDCGLYHPPELQETA